MQLTNQVRIHTLTCVITEEASSSVDQSVFTDALDSQGRVSMVRVTSSMLKNSILCVYVRIHMCRGGTDLWDRILVK